MGRIRSALLGWLGRSIGNRIIFAGVLAAAGLVLVLGVTTFPLFIYQAKVNFEEHAQNDIDRIGDILDFRLSATQQALDQLAKSSFVVNSFVDSSGREVYLSLILRDFRLPIDLPVKLVLFDANIKPFAGNMADFSEIGEKLKAVAGNSFKNEQHTLVAQGGNNKNSIALTFPVYYPPASSYEGVLVAEIDVDALLRLSDAFRIGENCLTVSSKNGPFFVSNCDATTITGHVSKKLSNPNQLADNNFVMLSFADKSQSVLWQLLLVFVIFMLIGIGAVVGTYYIARKGGKIFAEQLATLSASSLAIADNPNIQTRIRWEGQDEIGRFVEAFNSMVSKLQGLHTSLEERVTERTNELQIILDNVADAIITIDESGIVQSFNKSAEVIFGYEAEEVIGRNIKMLMPAPYQSEHDGYLKNYHDSGVAKIIGIGREVPGRRKNGSIFPIDLAISQSINKEKPIFIGLARDITERKRNDQLKNEFVSTVSHELRTPLTSINGALGLLNGGVLGELGEQAKKMVSTAYNNSVRLTVLINDLLDMEKLLAGKITFDMAIQPLIPLIEQTIDAMHEYGSKYSVTFKLIKQEELLVNVDSNRLIQVLNNFLSNAAKFSPQNDIVEIKVHKLESKVRVEIIDHGAGISDDFQARIFQKFSQEDSTDTRQKGGTGLGLAISKELIERMNGTIGFESTLNLGATFYFELPLAG